MKNIYPKILNLNFKEIIILILFFVLLFTIYISESLKPNEKFRVTFFDVGQGDAALFETPKNIKILIDGGPDNKIINHLGKHLNWFDKEIDMVVVTHDDADHIFGLIKVLEKYNIKVLFTSLPNSKNEIMQKIISLAKEKNVKVVTIDKPSIINTEDGVIIKFLFPVINLDGVEDGNNASIVTQIIYKNNNEDVKILMTGDLGIGGEKYLVEKYGGMGNENSSINNFYNSGDSENILISDILKLGHHGSDTSTSVEFLQKVKPKVAIVSAGKDNRFGHPHQSVLNLLNNFQIQILETAKQGNIYFVF